MEKSDARVEAEALGPNAETMSGQEASLNVVFHIYGIHATMLL